MSSLQNRLKSLFWELKRIPEFTKILGDGVESIALQEEEKKMLMEIGGQKHLFEMSQGYIVGDMVIITSGPMKKMKGTIIFIDRHKRVAIIQLDMFGRKNRNKHGPRNYQKDHSSHKFIH